MKIINASPYDTRALRSIICSVHRYIRRHTHIVVGWRELIVYVGARRPPDFQVGFDRGYIHVPNLQGTEWHERLRGITNGAALTSAKFAWLAGALFGVRGWDDRMLKKGTPEFVPLKVVKPKAPRNLLQERYQRVLQLEKAWQRKYKLAATKLKKLRLVRRRYEKKHLLTEAS